jgi:hypothetical protein
MMVGKGGERPFSAGANIAVPSAKQTFTRSFLRMFQQTKMM